jgi:hypothetical protein
METSPPPASGSEAWVEQFAATLNAERTRSREFLGAQVARLERAETVVEQQLKRLENELQGHCDEVGRLRDERDALATRLAEAEVLLQAAEERWIEQSGAVKRPTEGEDEDSQRRYEMALDDIRQLKNRNNDLQQQLDKSRSTTASSARESRQPGALDWETQKKNLLAALEASPDEENEAQQGNRQKIEDMLQTTNAIVAEKDIEIQGMRQRLEELESRTANEPDTAAVDKILNGDTVVQEERERLKRLQEEWRDKLRQAEVEIALERAKIARQRAEMESKQHGTEDTATKPAESTDASGKTERSSLHGRWLARLGLTNADLVPGRHL